MALEKSILWVAATLTAFAVLQSQAEPPYAPPTVAPSGVQIVAQRILMADESQLQKALEYMEKLKGALGESAKSPQPDKPTGESARPSPSDKPASESASSPVAIKKPTAPAGDPCKLLTTGELRKVFPDIKAGERDRSTEDYGATSCVWRDADGARTLILQRMNAEPEGVKPWLQLYLLGGWEDLSKPSPEKAARFETIKGIGDEAMAVVETADEKRGIPGNVAMLAAQKGDDMIGLASPDLARRERGAAIKALENLGKAAVKRL